MRGYAFFYSDKIQYLTYGAYHGEGTESDNEEDHGKSPLLNPTKFPSFTSRGTRFF